MMARRRAFWARFFTKGSGGGFKGDYKAQRRQEERRRAAMAAGRPDTFEQLPFLKPNKDPWTLERAKRREEVKEWYFKQKDQLRVQEKRAEEELERQLDRRKVEIDRHYRLNRLREGDPRLAHAQLMAQKKFALYRRQVLRKHRRSWHDRLRGLQQQREHQYREITKDMKRTSRRERGLPDEMQGPFRL